MSRKMWNTCRCCLNPNASSQDIYKFGTEVYETMLKETFNIEMSNNTKAPCNLICKQCVSRLQDASAFKAMVLQSRDIYEKFLHNCQGDNDNDIEVMKQEECEFKSDDDPLCFIKQEGIQSRNEDATVKLNRDNRESEKAVRKVKNKRNTGDTKSNGDWTKLTEQRGNGPILRENSLKLLENSTIFAFQWHKSKYRCFCCTKPFLDTNELRNHSEQHSIKDIAKKIIIQQNMLVKVEISILNCKVCREKLENLQELRDHLTIQHNFEFKMKEDLLVPFRISDDLACQICSEKFTAFRHLNIHMNRHFKKQICHLCGAAFSNLKFLNLHKYRHRLLKCKECNIEFSTRKEKNCHDATVHKVKIVKKLRFPCPHCDERYCQENLRILHLVDIHGMKRPEHKCSVCSKSFITKSLCTNHFKSVHKKERKHPCDICKNLFYTRSDVVRHKVTHTGEKKFSCALCSVTFASKDSLRRHMKRTHAVC
ncbi:PR domain zinc finger protein 5-like [Plodia interpunctella]|uniref:PR domain zinc finger protein 5-like n=1 Tax=Plodia interpunctella TaxID=58824 RepID=UPI00236895E6|nr:PR domain zinc finger protein 5-like [Plodia interpunctella]